MLVSDGIVYSGGNDGTVRALNAVTGKQVWTFQASGAVKDSLAYSTADACSSATTAATCTPRGVGTATSSGRHRHSGLSGGFGSGNFYSTPAVAYGRVYVGNTDSKVYSFVAVDGPGRVDETMPTGRTAHRASASAGCSRPPTTAPSTALRRPQRDAAVDAPAALPVARLGTVIGRLVYVADLGPSNSNGHLYALDVGNGKMRWEFHDGKYHPIVAADGHLSSPASPRSTCCGRSQV